MAPAPRKVIGAVAYILFMAIFVEIALQAFYYATAGDFLFRRVGLPIFATNEYSTIFNKPNLALEHHTSEFTATYYNNAVGFRVPSPGFEYPRQKDDATYRVMLLGPSFAYGWGVDFGETFAASLEKELEAAGYGEGKNIEVINAGVPSLFPAPHLRWYDHVGRTYSPDLVVQFIYGSMAVPNKPTVDAEVNDEGYLVAGYHSPARRLRERAKKLATVFYAWIVWTKLTASADPDSEGGDRGVSGAGRELKTASEFDPQSPDVVEALAFYRDLDATVRADGTALLVVYFPLSYAIHEEDVSRWKHLGVTDVSGQIAFDAAFLAHLKQLGMPAVNVTGDLQAAATSGERVYNWLDIHWTALGNRTAARAVANHLANDAAPH